MCSRFRQQAGGEGDFDNVTGEKLGFFVGFNVLASPLSRPDNGYVGPAVAAVHQLRPDHPHVHELCAGRLQPSSDLRQIDFRLLQFREYLRPMIGLELFLAKGGGRTLLIDGDSVHGALTTALLPNRRAASARLLSGESESGLRPLALENGFDFFPAARRSGVGALLACFKSRDVVRRLGENYDYVLIDLPPMLVQARLRRW